MAKKLAFDAILFTTVLILVGFGLTAVYSAGVSTVGPARLALRRPTPTMRHG